MSYLLLQGGGTLLLQSGTGSLLLQGGEPDFPPGSDGAAMPRSRRKRPSIVEELARDDDEVLRFVQQFIARL